MSSIRIGNQTSCHVSARLPYEFARAHGFDAFEWLSDKGPWGWCEEDTPHTERAELRRTAQQRGIRFSVHAPVTADPTLASGAEAIRRSIRFGGDVGAGVVTLHLFPRRSSRCWKRHDQRTCASVWRTHSGPRPMISTPYSAC